MNHMSQAGGSISAVNATSNGMATALYAIITTVTTSHRWRSRECGWSMYGPGCSFVRSRDSARLTVSIASGKSARMYVCVCARARDRARNACGRRLYSSSKRRARRSSEGQTGRRAWTPIMPRRGRTRNIPIAHLPHSGYREAKEGPTHEVHGLSARPTA